MVGCALQYICFTYAVMFFANIMCFGIGMSLFIQSSITDIQCHLKLLNKSIKSKDHRLVLIKQIRDFIQYYSDAKQLSEFKFVPLIEFQYSIFFIFRMVRDFLVIIQPMLMVTIGYSFITICSVFLIIQAELVKYTFLVKTSKKIIQFPNHYQSNSPKMIIFVFISQSPTMTQQSCYKCQLMLSIHLIRY